MREMLSLRDVDMMQISRGEKAAYSRIPQQIHGYDEDSSPEEVPASSAEIDTSQALQTLMVKLRRTVIALWATSAVTVTLFCLLMTLWWHRTTTLQSKCSLLTSSPCKRIQTVLRRH
jgi:uncharacterized membrane protein YgcG